MMELVTRCSFHESALECTVRESAQSPRGRTVSDLTHIRSPLKISMDDVASLKNFFGHESFDGSTSFANCEKSTSERRVQRTQAAPGELLRAAVSEEWVVNSYSDQERKPHSRCGSPSPTVSSSHAIDNVPWRERTTSSSIIEWTSRFGSSPDLLEDVHENDSKLDSLPKIESLNFYEMPEGSVAPVVEESPNCADSFGDVNTCNDIETLATEMGQWTQAYTADGFAVPSFSDGIVDFEWEDHNYVCPQSWSWNLYGDYDMSYQGMYPCWDGQWCEQGREQRGHRKSRAKEHRGHGAAEYAELPSEPTTVILRNIPCEYTSRRFVDLLDKLGFHRLYDYIYLPIGFVDGVNLGYAFVNLATYEDALAFTEKLHGFSDWDYESDKQGAVSWAQPCQGLNAHIERYRNSPVMHSCMPDEYKPQIFADGQRVPFPSPTKPIKTPKVRTKSAVQATVEPSDAVSERPSVLGGNPSQRSGASAWEQPVMSHAGCVGGLKGRFDDFPPLPSIAKTT
mmetsp:Transcript_56251/g.150293  ORF Transcript_56251/g.150293 Transcript_56251/m.150293 type:complete len:510 (-) Transcript_56251:297-1826(-)